MTAIFTKHLCYTDTKPARIKAYPANSNKGVIFSINSLENEFENNKENCNNEKLHKLAAEKLCIAKGWKGELVGGGTKEGFVWVFVD